MLLADAAKRAIHGTEHFKLLLAPSGSLGIGSGRASATTIPA